MAELVLNGIYLPMLLTDWVHVVDELDPHWLTHISLDKNRFRLSYTIYYPFKANGLAELILLNGCYLIG